MAVTANANETYDNLVLREDLQEAYAMISPEECPFQMAIATKTVTQPQFDWPVVELADPVMTNRVIEGDADVANDAPTNAVRFHNWTQISDKVAEVTQTNQASDAAASNVQRMSEQVSIKMKELKRDKEQMLLQNVVGSAGSSGNARVTAGLQAWIATNTAVVGTDGDGADPIYTSGTPTTAAVADTTGSGVADEETLNDIIEACWNEGATPTIIMCNGGNKRRISSTFTGNSTRYKDSVDKKLVAAIDFYDSDFGELTVVPNRFLPALDAPTTTVSYSVLVLDPDYARVAYLDEVQQKPLAETGHSIRTLVWCEYGLQVDNEKAHGIMRDTDNTAATA